MTERINRMAQSVLEKSIYPEPKSVDYDRMYLLLPDVIMNTKRLCDYLLAQDVVITEDSRLVGQLRFDGSVPSNLFPRTGHKRFGEVASKFYCKPLESLVTFEWQHSTLNYSDVLEQGIEGMLERIRHSREVHKNEPEKVEFLNACELMCNGILAWEDKCAAECRKKAESAADSARKAELVEMAEILDRVPRKPAHSFREAVQTVYFCFDFLSDSIGTPDRYLYKFFKADRDGGKLTDEEAKALLQELFIRIQSFTPIGSTAFTRGGESHFSVGGYTLDDEDGYNELSELIVTALMELPLYIPQISFRWTPKTPHDVLYHIMDLERHDKNKRIAFVNDVPRIKAFTELCGFSREDAYNYTMLGCNEPGLQGGIYFAGNKANFGHSLESTLYNHRDELIGCRSFDEFFDIYTGELHADIDRIIEISDGFNLARAKDENVLSSMFMKGSIESGISVTRGGTTGVTGFETIGIVNVIDSLSIIKQFVFEERLVSFEKLLDALEHNWVGYEDLLTSIKKKGAFFGNGYELSDGVAHRLVDVLTDHLKGKRNIFGKPFLLGNLSGYHPHQAWFGALTKATPDGRRNGDPFVLGLGQIDGKDREGLTALLTSIARFNHTGICSGSSVTNVNLDAALVRDDDNFAKLVTMVETYFKMGGLHIQLNSITAEELIAAKNEPDKYKSLRVRVSGYSDYFVRLGNEMQNDIIKRTRKGV